LWLLAGWTLVGSRFKWNWRCHKRDRVVMHCSLIFLTIHIVLRSPHTSMNELIRRGRHFLELIDHWKPIVWHLCSLFNFDWVFVQYRPVIDLHFCFLLINQLYLAFFLRDIRLLVYLKFNLFDRQDFYLLIKRFSMRWRWLIIIFGWNLSFFIIKSICSDVHISKGGKLCLNNWLFHSETMNGNVSHSLNMRGHFFVPRYPFLPSLLNQLT